MLHIIDINIPLRKVHLVTSIATMDFELNYKILILLILG